MPIKRNLTNTSMTERIMTWFKSLFFKRKRFVDTPDNLMISDYLNSKNK